MICRMIIVKGKVQGVNYRYYTKIMADRLRVTGWAKNMDDGNVEILACSDDEASIIALTEFCRKGPTLARVTELEVKEAKVNENLTKFDIL